MKPDLGYGLLMGFVCGLVLPFFVTLLVVGLTGQSPEIQRPQFLLGLGIAAVFIVALWLTNG